MIKPAPALFELRAGRFVVELAPSLGGCIASARHEGRDVLRPLTEQARAADDILAVACFPLVPYANRIDRNQFEFDGRVHHFEANLPPYPFNEHGSGWTSAWTVLQRSASHSLLGLERLEPDAPYSFRATQEFTLLPDQLAIRTSVTNLGPVRMPFGLGQHPWFWRDADTTLRFVASHFWLEGPGGSATDRITLPEELDFAQGRPLPASWRNNCYAGWRGTAEIFFPSRDMKVTLAAEPLFRHLMLYADPALPVFCLEPQSHASCAFNKLQTFSTEELGVSILEPGESIEGGITIGVAAVP